MVVSPRFLYNHKSTILHLVLCGLLLTNKTNARRMLMTFVMKLLIRLYSHQQNRLQTDQYYAIQNNIIPLDSVTQNLPINFTLDFYN